MNLSALVEIGKGSCPIGMEEFQNINQSGLAGWLLNREDYLLTSELSERCKDLTLHYLLRYEVFREEMTEFLKIFPSAVPIKGMSLIPRIYAGHCLRRVSDIDLYYPGDFQEIRKYFTEQGFSISEDDWEPDQFKLNVTKVIQGVEVPFEIHRELLWKCKVDWHWQNDHRTAFQTLVPEDELVYLSGHLAYQHTMLSINWLIDIALLLKTVERWDARRIEDLLEKIPLRNSLSTCLWACESVLQVTIPVNLKPFVRKNVGNKAIHLILTEFFLWTPTKYPVRYYLLKHLLKDSIGNALLYNIIWLKHHLWKKIFTRKKLAC
ncbi:MAG: nucleotidyltransferase family protein [Bdellovibrionales bacterium]|nr:nucleotidyltransferase family protein [Oligoflexia bacterium]